MFRITALLGCAAILLIPAPGRAATSFDRDVQWKELVRATPGNHPPGTLGIELDANVYRSLRDRGRVTVRDFPLPAHGLVDLELESFSVIAPGARFVVVDGYGERDVAAPDVRFFKGTVFGELDSRVTLTMFGGRIAGTIRVGGGEYVFGPESFDPDDEAGHALTVRDRAVEPPETQESCGAEELMLDMPLNDQDFSTTISGDTMLTAQIAIDATVEWYQAFGDLTAAQTYILNLMAQVSTIYENEVLVKVEVPYLRVFTADPDPYTNGSTSTSTLLADLRSEWTNNMGGVTRTAAHLFSKRPSGGAGLAYVNVLCNGSYGFGVSTLSAQGGSWEKELVAHEIGHNFASPHTHCYVPEIDQCANESGCYAGSVVQSVGTIMSYCSSSDPVFHPRVKAETIRPAAEGAYPLCVTTAGLPGSVNAGSGGDGGLAVDKPQQCNTATLQNDDDNLNSYFGYGGTTRMAWIKRVTPTCYPFQLDAIDVLTGHSSVVPGRPVRLLVYTDAAGAGDPAGSTLAHTEDTTLQVVSNTQFNHYVLSDPVIVTEGDLYVGMFDLLDDGDSTYIGSVDSSASGDSFYAGESTSPGSFNSLSDSTWLIRGQGGAVPAEAVLLSWDPPCNAGAVPDQDYAVYRGALGDYLSHDSLTCSTGRADSFMDPADAGDTYFLVVPVTAAAEGSYGQDSLGLERTTGQNACRIQEIAACP